MWSCQASAVKKRPTPPEPSTAEPILRLVRRRAVVPVRPTRPYAEPNRALLTHLPHPPIHAPVDHDMRRLGSTPGDASSHPHPSTRDRPAGRPRPVQGRRTPRGGGEGGRCDGGP